MNLPGGPSVTPMPNVSPLSFIGVRQILQEAEKATPGSLGYPLLQAAPQLNWNLMQ